MTEIITIKGERYSFDPDTERIFKDGYLLPSYQAEPIYTQIDENIPPEFSGILLKDTGLILSLSGKLNKVIDVEELK